MMARAKEAQDQEGDAVMGSLKLLNAIRIVLEA